MNTKEVKDRVTEYTDVYKMVPIDAANGLYQLIAVPGTVTEEGDPINHALFEDIRRDIRASADFFGKPIVLTGSSAEAANAQSVEVAFDAVHDPFGGSSTARAAVPSGAHQVLVTLVNFWIGVPSFGAGTVAICKNGVAVTTAQQSDVSISTSGGHMRPLSCAAVLDVAAGDLLTVRLTCTVGSGVNLYDGGVLRVDILE